MGSKTAITRLLRLGLLVCLATAGVAGSAAQTSNEIWPQFNAYYKAGDHFQLLGTMEERVASDSKDTNFRIGPMLLFHLPVIFHGEVLRNHYEDNRFLTLGAGYLYITPGPGGTGSVEQRGILQLIPRIPLPKKMLLGDRNQADLRWISGSFYWRYRNQLTWQRNFSIHSYALTPFARGEVQYYSKYGTWYRTTYGAGVRLPLGKMAEFQPYYEHQNTSQGQPAHVNALGLVLSLFFGE